MTRDTVWIPAVPLPFQGWRRVRCGKCGARFGGRRWFSRNAFESGMAAYELHYRAEHQWGENPDVQVEVPREKAAAILCDVLAYQAERA